MYSKCMQEESHQELRRDNVINIEKHISVKKPNQI